jgi:acyl-CoA thioester hydrolase
MARPTPRNRAVFPHFRAITTRWMDNDVYRHVNNVIYYSFFDTAVNQYLLEAGVLDIEKSPIIGLVVETQCNYFSSLSFPDLVHAGLRVEKIGESSVTYEIALFRNDSETACAQGRFVHVYVDRATQRPARVPENVRAALAPLSRPLS